MKKLGFGELEMAIQKIVQELGRVSVRQVYERLGSQGSYTTIMTVMRRMAEKTELIREKEGKQYFYWVNPSPKPPGAFKRIKERLFGGKSMTWICYLLESDDISKEELDQLEKLIKSKREKKKNG